MTKNQRHLTEKYKNSRLAPDAFYQSRTIETLLNKFIKQGEKTTSRRHIMLALTRFRFLFKRPPVYNTLFRLLKTLRNPLTLITGRAAKEVIQVPVPMRRNKSDVMALQTIAAAVSARKERSLDARVEQELLDLTIRQATSPTLRQRNIYMRQIHDQNSNARKR